MITFKTIALLSPVFVCGIFGLLFFNTRSSSNRPRAILKYLMFVGMIFSLTIMMNQTGRHVIYAYLSPLFYSFLLLLVPLFYFYVLSLTTEKVLIRDQWYHCLPSLIYLVIPAFLLFLLDHESRLQYVGHLFNGDDSFKSLMKLLYFCYYSNKLVFAFQVLLYFIIINKLIRLNRQTINSLFSSNDKLKLEWLLLLNIAFIAGAFNGVIINLLPTQMVNHDEYSLPVSLILFSVFFFIMGLLGSRQQPIMQIIENNDRENTYDTEVKTDSLIMLAIHEYITDKKAYMEPDLNIWDVARALCTNRTYISSAINKETGMNFNVYVNKVRIEAALKTMNGKKGDYNIREIFTSCGFNSMSTFYRYFKAQTGQSPLEYMKRGITF